MTYNFSKTTLLGDECKREIELLLQAFGITPTTAIQEGKEKQEYQNTIVFPVYKDIKRISLSHSNGKAFQKNDPLNTSFCEITLKCKKNKDYSKINNFDIL